MPQVGKVKKPGKRCPKCGRRCRLNFDKTVRDHFLKQASYNPETRELCSGSGKKPTQELRGERATRR